MAKSPRPVFRSHWERRLGRVDSPIEALFLEAFCPLALEYGYALDKRARHLNETIVVMPQKDIDQYRVDFLISFHFFGAYFNVAVECDGHEFHEKTKKQAARDKQRDRDLARLGVQTMRFTGSELYTDPSARAMEVLDLVMTFQTNQIPWDGCHQRSAA